MGCAAFSDAPALKALPALPSRCVQKANAPYLNRRGNTAFFQDLLRWVVAPCVGSSFGPRLPSGIVVRSKAKQTAATMTNCGTRIIAGISSSGRWRKDETQPHGAGIAVERELRSLGRQIAVFARRVPTLTLGLQHAQSNLVLH